MTQPQTQNALANVMPKMFTSIAYNGLNDAITALANRNTALSPEEKQAGKEIIHQWEQNVLQVISQRRQYMQSVIDYFKNSWSTVLTDDEEAQLAQVTETQELYANYLTVEETWRELRENAPERPIEGEEDTRIQIAEAQAAYKVELTRHNIAVEKANRIMTQRQQAWKRVMVNHPHVKDMLKAARKFTAGVGDLQSQCKEKSQLATMNIMIDNAEIRDSLRSMINFVATI